MHAAAALSAWGGLAVRGPVIASSLVLLSTPAPGQDLDEVLALARRARGEPSAVVLEGDARVRGTDAAFRLEAAGARVELAIDGPVGFRTGFDGERVWRVDASAGVPFPLDLWLGDMELARLGVLTGAWLEEGFPLSVELHPEPSNEDAAVLRLRSRTSSFEAALHLDAASHLPLRLVLEEPWVGPMEWRYADFRAVAGRVVAKRMTTFEETGEGDVLRVTGGAASSSPSPPGAQPEVAPVNVELDRSAPRALEVRRAPAGWLLVRPRVDGEDVGWFVFDTGASVSVIEPAVAAQLGLPSFGSGRRGGAGPEVTRTALRQGASLELGPLTLREPVYVEMALQLPTGSEPPVAAGVLGWDVLIQAVVEVDVKTPAIAIHPADGYELPAGEWLPLVLHVRHPHVTARFDGGEGLFRLDTGAGGDTCLFHAPAVERLGLLEGRETIFGSGGGAGGRIEWRSGVIDWFEIAGQRVDRPRVRFSLDRKGALADPNTLGNLGGAFLQPFVLAFDYRHRRLGFVPRAARDR